MAEEIKREEMQTEERQETAGRAGTEPEEYLTETAQPKLPEDRVDPADDEPAPNVLITKQTLRIFVAMYLGYVVTQLMKSVIRKETIGTEAIVFCGISVFFLAAIVWLVWPAVKQFRDRNKS